MSKVHETLLMLIERFPEIITLSSKRDVVENKPDEYLLTIMRSNVRYPVNWYLQMHPNPHQLC